MVTKDDGRLWLLLVSSVVLSALVSVPAGALGAQETAARDVRDFDSVAFATAGELIITQGDREGLEVVARAEDLPNIVTEVNDGTLTIGWRGAGPAFSFRHPVFRLSARTITSGSSRPDRSGWRGEWSSRTPFSAAREPIRPAAWQVQRHG